MDGIAINADNSVSLGNGATYLKSIERNLLHIVKNIVHISTKCEYFYPDKKSR